jgi:hypothetical protein
LPHAAQNYDLSINATFLGVSYDKILTNKVGTTSSQQHQMLQPQLTAVSTAFQQV